MICKHCGKSIPNTAETCPYCGESTKGSFGNRKSINWGKLIALLAAVLVLISIFIPTFTLNLANLKIRFMVNDYKNWILIIASVVAMIAMLAPKLELLYPLATIAIGWVYADRIRYAIDWFRMIVASTGRFGLHYFSQFAHLFSIQYSSLFLIGYTIMVLATIFIILKYTIGKFFSK